MKRFVYLTLAGFGLLQAHAQDATLHGIVSDASGSETLVGASVQYASNKGMVTDVDGAFLFTIPPGEYEVRVSMIGYVTLIENVLLTAGEDRKFDVKLKVSTAQLDQVVVSAGRFEQRVGEVTQSLSVLRPEIVQNKNITSMSDALDQVPGVVVVDEDPQIRAGSGFSYGAGSRVQVLVDDIPILSGDIGRPNWTFLPLENLEQIEVIKGASSVLYGSA
ncbi:MAG: TonB-dependent receptor, partial [Flavobacteriales bacterium]